MAKRYFKNAERNQKRYEVIANGLCALVAANDTGPDDQYEPVLDPVLPHQMYDDVEPPLGRALQRHFQDLFMSLDWNRPETIRKFYPSMRAWVDQLVEERHQSEQVQSDLEFSTPVIDTTGKAIAQHS